MVLVKDFKEPSVSIKLYGNQDTVPNTGQQHRFRFCFGETRPKYGSSVVWEVYYLTKEERDFHRQNKGSS